MVNVETATKFSKLKSISSIEDNYSFTLVIYNYHPLLWRKCLLKLGLKKPEFLKGFFNLFVFGFLFTIIKKNYDLLWCRKCSLKLDYVI